MKDEQQDIEEVQPEEVIDYKELWIRAQADYQNLQKETSKQRAQWNEYARSEVLEDVIPILENFKKAFAHDATEDKDGFENWKKGIGFIKKQLEDVLAQYDIEMITTVGEVFDPLMHEAVSEKDSDETEGVILEEISGGYKMGERVILPAKVVVST